MDNQKLKNNGSRKLIIFEIVCVILMITLIGYTYSYFNVTATNDTVITGQAASLSLDLTVTKVAPSNNNGLVPQLDSAITNAVTGRNGSCIDDNNNSVCQVYQITVKNTSSAAISVNGKVKLNAGSNPNLKWAQISGTTNPTLVSSINPYSVVNLTKNELYNANETKNYYIVVWISETGVVQSDTGNFTGVVTFSDANQSPAKETLSNLGLTANTTTPDFSIVATTDEGIFSTEDDLGTSYYFRGAVTNNYVRFANFYWRIIRINGDGSIRMIYDGTSAHANGESSTDRQIGTSKYNSSFGDNAYVGYMYGTIGASDYNATHANTNNSAIKTTVDNWYKTNIVDAGYSGSVVDAIYCNDREVSTADTTNYPGDGSGKTNTAYKAYERLSMNKTPTLKCNQVNARFTIGATIEGVTGNGKLTYPVGLITADEVSMAGGVYAKSNSSYYLYTNNWYWTMSPFYFSGSHAYAFVVNSDGHLLGNYVNYSGDGVRLVISLSSSAITGGTGSSTDPFVVS